MKLQIVLFQLLFSIGTVFSLTWINCPVTDQYPYGGCSSCFSIPSTTTRNLSFADAEQFCQDNGGSLLTVRDMTDFDQLSHYFDGLSETRPVWIGYRYNTTGVRVALDAELAPRVIQNDQNFVGSIAGDKSTCIAMQGSWLINVACSDTLPFACIYSYGVPSVMQTPSEKIVHIPPSELNFNLSAVVSSPSVTSLTVQWRHNNTPILTTGYLMNAENGLLPSQRVFTLTILTFNVSIYAGVYELLVTGPAGTAVSATWDLRKAVLGVLTVEPQNVTVLEEQIAAFECAAGNALPRASVIWYKDSLPFNVSSSNRYYMSDVTGTLFIRDARASDEGEYSCECVNSVGSVTSVPAALSVVNSFQSDITDFFINPRPMTLLAGEPYSLECVGWQTYDLTITSYRFFFNQSFFSTDPDDRFTYPTDPGFPVYRIESISVEEATNCTSCTISPATPTRFDEIQDSAKVPLTVHDPAAVSELVTLVNGIETEDSLVPVPSGADVTLRCEYTGIPAPSMVEWTQDGTLVQNGVVSREGVSTLSLVGVTSGSVYQCHVTNEYGRDTGAVFICPENEEMLPGVVSFNAQPNTQTSLYITWDHPPTTHPLLLRYEVNVQQVGTGELLTSSPPPGVRSHVVTGLLSGELYRVSVVATSLLGRGEESEQDILVRTFEPPIRVPVSGVTAQQTSDNVAIVISWDPISRESIATLPLTYEVQYRVMDSDQTILELVNDDSNILVVQGLTNAGTYEVRVRVITLSQRDPVLFIPAPWSTWMKVAGITTLPPLQPGTPTTGTFISLMGLLLVYVCVPVGVVTLVGVCLCVTIIVWCCCQKNRKRVYHPSREERRSIKNEQVRPMGSQVYALPLNNHITNQPQHVWVENTGYTQYPPPNYTTITAPSEGEAPTPALSMRSGTVTITYLEDQESSSTTSSSSVIEPANTEWNNASVRPHTATPGNRHDNTRLPMSAKGSTSFDYYYSEAKGAEDDMYRLAVSLDMDLSRSENNLVHHGNKRPTPRSVSNIDIKNRRVSEEYDSLEPSPDIVGTEQVDGVNNNTDFDFAVLEELAVESAAMASVSGKHDPYAPLSHLNSNL